VGGGRNDLEAAGIRAGNSPWKAGERRPPQERCARFVEGDAAAVVLGEGAVEDDDVEVEVGIEGGAARAARRRRDVGRGAGRGGSASAGIRPTGGRGVAAGRGR
jgi:hypothetical protein